jgi:hypothetical protein
MPAGVSGVRAATGPPAAKPEATTTAAPHLNIDRRSLLPDGAQPVQNTG